MGILSPAVRQRRPEVLEAKKRGGEAGSRATALQQFLTDLSASLISTSLRGGELDDDS